MYYDGYFFYWLYCMVPRILAVVLFHLPLFHLVLNEKWLSCRPTIL